jgi:hypothetical protein
LGFDPIASSHFHVIEYVGVDGLCAGVEIYLSKLQHGFIRNLNRTRILMWHFTDNQVCFLMVVYIL